MPKCRVSLAGCFLAGLLSIPLLGWRDSLGSEIPRTSYSQSLGIHPVFLDYPSLVFQFPQAAPLFPGQILAFTDGSVIGVGGIFQLGRQRLFVLAQPRAEDFLGLRSGTSLLQAGWAGSWSPVRVGLALRGGMRREERSTTHTYFPYWLDQSHFDDRAHLIEGSAGVSLGSGPSHVDAALEYRRDTFDQEASRLRVEQDQSDTLVAFFHLRDRPMVIMRLRGQWSLRPSTNLLVAGHWGERTQEWDVLIHGEESDLFTRLNEYEDTWSIGLAVSTKLAHVDSLMVAAYYQSARRPEFRASNDAERFLAVTRRAILGISYEKRVWAQLESRAGISTSYTFDRRGFLEYQWRGDTYSSESKAESFSEQFAWGLSYSWKRFHFAGALSSPLRLDFPFFSMDLAYHL